MMKLKSLAVQFEQLNNSKKKIKINRNLTCLFNLIDFSKNYTNIKVQINEKPFAKCKWFFG